MEAAFPLTTSFHDTARKLHIHHLAPEILGDIFFHCVPTSSSLPAVVSFNDAPLLLLQVCRYWRQIAWRTPYLWTSLNLDQALIRRPSNTFQMWLDNAGSLLLKVHLPFKSHIYIDKTEAEAVMELLLDNFDRLLELSGSLMPWFAKNLLRRNLPIQAPFLRRLDVGGWDKLSVPLDLERLRRSMVVPQLQICNLNSLRFQLSLLCLDPTRLRELNGLWVISVAEFESMEILSSFTSLQSLNIYLHIPTEGTVLKIPPRISIPSLRCLKIGTYSGYDPELFLGALDVHFIEHLELLSSAIGESPIGPLLDSLTNGNIPPLKSLALIGYNVVASECIPWLSRFTQLQTLIIDRGMVDAGVLMMLTYNDVTSPDLQICPCLATMHFKHVKLPLRAVQGLVASRVPGGDAGGCLRRVTFEDCEGLEENHRAAFSKIQDISGGLIQIEFISGKVCSY